MTVLCERINLIRKRADKVKKYYDKKENQDVIFKNALRYRHIVSNLNTLSDILLFLNTKLDFFPTEDLLNKIKSVIEQSQKCVYYDEINVDYLEKAELAFKQMNELLKKEWKEFYSNISGSVLSVLKLVNSVDPETVQAHINNINQGERFEYDLKKYELMYQSIQDAQAMIDNMNMDNEIKEFLRKMTSGKARVSDLNEKIFRWILDNGLGRKIMLEFKK